MPAIARALHGPTPVPDRRSAGDESPRAGDSEVPQPDSADARDLDAALAGMSMLLRLTLRALRSAGSTRQRGTSSQT